MSATNGIVGDSFGTELPQSEVPQEGLLEEKRMAKFSRTKEFGVLKQHLEDRIEYYQTLLPGSLGAEPSMEDWRVANIVIGELRAIIAAYENAAEVVKNVG